jgi:hypothetical protein
MAKLQYPASGDDSCTSITDCLRITVLDTSTASLDLTLVFNPEFGDPVRIEYTIIVNECNDLNSEALSLPAELEDLVYSRSAIEGNVINVELDPTFSSQFAYSDIEGCPIAVWDL